MNDFKVDDIHHPGVTEEFDRLTLKDLECLLQKSDQFIDTGCPACHSLDVDHAFEYQGLGYRRCDECELLYISPAPSEELHLDYVINSSAMAYWRETANPEMKHSRRPMYQERVTYSLKKFKMLGHNPKTSLEVGGGNGEFAEELAKTMELEQIVVLEPQKLNLDSGLIEVVQGGFDDMLTLNRKFDVVFAWELIEHILEPDHFLKRVREVMSPDAMFVLSTPNEKSTETRKLGTDSSNILFDHVRLYNPQAITQLFQRNGFRIIDLETPGLLDVERLQAYYRKYPEAFVDDATLEFLLQADEETKNKFQRYLQSSLRSSHMRVVATIDGKYRGGTAPRLRVGNPGGNPMADKPSDSQPLNFNDVVLPHVLDTADPYPPKLMRHILNDIVKINSGRLVDLGGGWGQHAKIASEMGFEVTSVDRENAALNIDSVICDFMVDPLPFEDNSIDAIYSKSVIEHFYVRDLPHIMNEVMRVLKPGGAFVITTPDWEYNTKEFYRVFTHVTPYTKSSLKQCLQMYGFDRVETQNLVQLPMVWGNDLLRILSNITAVLPLPRSISKWVRWSKERLLLGLCYKPVG